MARKTVLPLIRKARAGDAISQFKLGCLYLKGGQGLAANTQSALLWLGKAADKGYAEAWRLIGERISLEHAESTPRLIRWFEMAANDGCAPAQTKLALLMLSNKQIAKEEGSTGTAIDLLRVATGKGDSVAQAELGFRFLQGEFGCKGSPDEGIDLLERAYADGQIIAARHLADYYWQRGVPDLARQWYSRCVNLRDMELCYRFGLLSTLLGESGKEYLYRAAEAGHPLACEELGLRYALGCRDDPTGKLGSRSFKKSVRWLERATSLGSAKACFFLAMLYDHQNCSFRSRSKSRQWLWDAASRGYPEAQYRVGHMLMRGPDKGRSHRPAGIPIEDADIAAVRFLADAAYQGHLSAAQELDAAGCRVAPLDENQASLWTRAVRAMTPLSLPVATRIELASVMGLRVSEMLLIDPIDASRGNYFVVDLRRVGIRCRRRVILIEHRLQREVIEKAKSLFSIAHPLPGDLIGNYRSRYKKFTQLCIRADIGHQLFARTTPDASASIPASEKSLAVAAGARRITGL